MSVQFPMALPVFVLACQSAYAIARVCACGVAFVLRCPNGRTNVSSLHSFAAEHVYSLATTHRIRAQLHRLWVHRLSRTT